MNFPKVIAIVGPNASGKSSIGVELARVFDGEIISADSRQVYRGFDLCCGMITAEETKGIRHYLLSVRDIEEPFSSYEFQRECYTLIPQILRRGNVPFLVGGTGNYIRSVVEGYSLSDGKVDFALRKRLEGLSVEQLQSMLPPEIQATLNFSDLQNPRRLSRLIEKITNREPLEHRNEKKYNVLQLGITWPKEVLHRRIDERLESRIEQGMISEVQTYLDHGGSEEILRKLGLEYKYTLRLLTGELKTMDEYKLELSRAIKHFAKKQMTWFKKDTVHWLDMEADFLTEARALISEFLAN